MSGKSALIIGATGAVGKHTLSQLLGSTHFSRVSEFGRRVTAQDQLAAQNPPGKLEQKVVNFEKIGEEGLADGKYDVVIITLGTTRAAAGGMEGFVKIDREYVINSARAARVPGVQQRLLYVSSFGADPGSALPYAKSKGLTEEGLAKLGYDDLVVLRPGFLKNRGGDFRLGEHIAGFVTHAMSFFTPNMEVETTEVAKSIHYAAVKGSAGLPKEAAVFKAGGKGDVPEYTVIPNKGQLKLANLDV
ncbi:NAD(P)-binding protein, partial [Clavulina sp. PMI_390]